MGSADDSGTSCLVVLQMNEIWILGATGRTVLALAAQLAAANLSPVLVGRNPARLRDLATAIGTDPRIVTAESVEAVVRELSRNTPAVAPTPLARSPKQRRRSRERAPLARTTSTSPTNSCPSPPAWVARRSDLFGSDMCHRYRVRAAGHRVRVLKLCGQYGWKWILTACATAGSPC